MYRLFRFFIRSWSFVGKELTAILRQPRLILSLVLGPFLIIILFGIGFPNQSRNLRTTFVVEAESPFTAQMALIAERLSSPILYQGVENDKNVALTQLALNQTDLVVVVPKNPEETIRNNQQAKFLIYHNEVDPFQGGYIQYIGNSLTELFNRKILQSITSQGQEDAASIQTSLETAIANAQALREALEANDLETAVTEKEALDTNLDLVRLAIGGTLAVISGVNDNFGTETNGTESEQEILTALEEINQSTSALNNLGLGGDVNFADKVTEAQDVEEKLSELNEKLTEFRSLAPEIIVSPFTSETSGLSGVQFAPISFFAPAMIALLLQHIAITFAALSIVRERKSGIMELFRVAPISALETLIGKFLSYLVFGILLAAALTALIIGVLGIPMLGNWLDYSLAVMVLLFTSLGLGFLVSLISDTDTQAAQYSMLLLLASIFFSGFFLDLRLMWQPIRFIPWSLPATYGVRMLQDIMLRGYVLPTGVFQGVLAMGLILFLMNWFLLRKKMETP